MGDSGILKGYLISSFAFIFSSTSKTFAVSDLLYIIVNIF